MPVTIFPAPHSAKPFDTRYSPPVTDSLDLLKKSCRAEAAKIKNDHIIQSSFEDVTSTSNIYPRSNGFVDGAINAYNNHHHLEIRTEDVWFSILAQLNIYIRKNDEELRHMFVAHEGQKHLQIEVTGVATLLNVDYVKISLMMAKMIEDNVKDPSLRDWIMPNFTTTTKTDEVVASILMMSTLQNYFTYEVSLKCGLPSVTLLGEKSDWKSLARKAERIVTFGNEARAFYGLLKPILSRFISSFNAPETEETKDFWQKIANQSGGGSGPTYYNGWITAFCFWGSEGKCFYKPGRNPKSQDDENAKSIWDDVEPVLQLDEARYHCIETTEVPPGWASVPVMLNNLGLDIPCSMVAGSVGIRLKSSGKDIERYESRSGGRELETLSNQFGGTGLDTISIESGWWIYEGMTEDDIQKVKKSREGYYGYQNDSDDWNNF